MDKFTFATTVVGSMVAIGTLVNAVWQYRRKVHLEIFRTYADKYNAILSPDIYGKWVSALRGNRELWEEMNPIMIRYLNLVWEESYLSQNRAIPRGLWRIWLPEITEVLSSDFARHAARTYGFHFPIALSSGRSPLTTRSNRVTAES
jgi:hypothetical protein